METLDRLIIIGLCILSILLIGETIGEITQHHKDKVEAVQKGFAHYNPTNADFEWNMNLVNINK